MQAETSTETRPTPPPAALIVFGRDDTGRPHASQFSEADAELAEKAAELMGMRTLRVTTDIEANTAARLPLGRVFASGKAFVPFVAGEVFAALEAAAGNVATGGDHARVAAGRLSKAKGSSSGVQAGDQPGNAGEPASEPARPPSDWGGIGPNSLVLATTGVMQGWYEAVVIEAKADDLFTLQWRDWPDDPRLARRREHLALLHPALDGV
jgi:hypothetical protein